MPKIKIIRKAGRVKSNPVIWSIKACFLKAFDFLMGVNVLLDSIAPQKLSICRLSITALASIKFYLIFTKKIYHLGIWSKIPACYGIFYLKIGQNPNCEFGKLSVISKKPKSSSNTTPSQFLAMLSSSSCK